MADNNYLKPIESVFSPLNAMEEASRCLLCHDAPCSEACPAGTNPGKFIRSLRFKNVEGAVETIRENNVLGGCCALVCPYEKYCEGACLRTGIDKPIKIGKIQEYLMEYESLLKLKILKRVQPTKGKIAIIGSGPAGLSSSASLALLGYSVTVFEKREKCGGWLSYGIPPARLSQEVVEREIGHIRDLGVEFINNIEIGRDKTIEDLRKDGFKAILVTIGLQKGKVADISGNNLKGVYVGVDFLAKAKSSLGKVQIGKKVIVIGGGDVAIDCAISAKLLGADDVKVIYRRKISDMPAGIEEKKHLYSMDIPVFTGILPKEILGKEGIVNGFVGVGMNDDTQIQLSCDTVIWAIGQENVEIAGLVFSKDSKGNYCQNEFETQYEGVFVSGDIVDGDKTVVNAVAQGKKVTSAIDKFLSK